MFSGTVERANCGAPPTHSAQISSREPLQNVLAVSALCVFSQDQRRNFPDRTPIKGEKRSTGEGPV